MRVCLVKKSRKMSGWLLDNIVCVCCHIYLVSSHLVVNIYLFVWWWWCDDEIKILWFFSLCNSHLIWMFWGKNLEPFWIIIEQCYKDCREAIITRCDVFIISLLRSDDLPKEMRRQATIQEFSPSDPKEQTKLHRHWLDANWIYIDYLLLLCLVFQIHQKFLDEK